MDVEIRFEGDARDAETAILSLDAALEQIDMLAKQVSDSLGDIKLNPGQAASFVAETAMMEAALSRLESKARSTNREMSQVGSYRPGTLLAAAVTGLPFGQDRRTFAGGPAEQGLVPYNPTNPLLVDRVFATSGEYAQRARAFGGAFDSIGRYDQYPIRYGAGMGGEIAPNGVLESFSDRGRGGLLGRLFGASGGSNDGGRISDILSGLGDGGGGGRGGGRYDVPGPNILAGLLPGGARARPAALATAALGAVSIAPELGAPILGGLAALPEIATTGAAALGTLKLALNGVSAAIGGNAKEYADLNKQAQQFVLTVRGLDPSLATSPLHAAQASAQAGLLPGLTSGLSGFFSPATRAGLTSTAGLYGRTIGGIASQAGSFLGSNGMQQMLKELATAGAGNLKNLAETLTSVADAFTRIGVAAIPLTKWFGDMAAHAADLFDHFVQGKSETGQLTSFFTNLEQPISMISRLIEEVVKVLADLVSVLSGAGKVALQGLIDLLTGLDHWLQQNHDSLAKVATFMSQTFVGALQLVAPVVSTVATGLAELAAAVSSLGQGLGALPAVIALVAGGLIALKTNPEIAALLAAMTALGYLANLKGHDNPNDTAQFPPGTTDPRDITGVRRTRAEEVIALQKKGWSVGQIQSYLSGDSAAIKGFPQFAKGSSGDIALGSAFTDAKVLTTGLGGGNQTNPTPGAEGKYYVSPVRPGTKVARLDQGVDYQGKPGDYVVAIGNAMIDAVKDNPGGFGKAIYYTLEDGPAAGQQIYVGHAQPLVRAGQKVKKGDSIAVLLKSGLGNAAGLSGWAEIGFASGNAPVSQSASDTGPAKQFQDFVAGNQTRYTGGGSSPWTPGPAPKGTPPTSWQLPLKYQTAIAKASTTSGTGDDVSALNAAIHYIRGIVHSLSGQDLVSAYNELASLESNLKSIATAAKSGRSTAAQRLSARTAGSSVLGMIHSALGPASGMLSDATNPLSILDSAPYAAAQDQLEPTLKAQRAKILEFEKELREKLISSEAVSTIRARIAQIRQNVTSELSQLKQAAQQQASDFKSVWSDYVSTFDTQFQQQTSDILANPEKYPGLLPLSAALADLQDQHTQQQLQQALTDAQKQLADALNSVGDQGMLDAARKKLSQDALAHALDVAQSYILGGTPKDMTDRIIKDLQDALTAGAPDQAKVDAANQAVADAEYNIKVDGLQKQATAEQTAFQQSRTELQKHLDESLAMWGTYYAKSGETAGEALGSLNALLVKFGFQPITDTGGGGANPFPQPGLTTINSSGALVPVQNSPTSPAALFNLLQGRVVGMADGGLISAPHYLVDMKGRITGMVGEKAPELVVPVNTSGGFAGAMQRRGAAPGGDGVQVNLHFAEGMGWLSQFVSAEISQNGSLISRQQGIAANRRQRSGRF